ncbi:MAG: family transcriptional regulator, cyclic receptor protein [Gaiellaceae bacterium]|jgi:DNA-binding transcriptional ArsR family regulator|nr:family transcriptional regulator, cyclic receptor protein [Gaiellaceae bacterium]
MALAAPAGPSLRAASLFDIDPELAERLDSRQRIEARTRAIVPVADLTAGPWSPQRLNEAVTRPFALMVVDGLVLRELLLGGSTATELLGPCDIVATCAPGDALLPTDTHWSVPQAARVAILDDRLLQILRAWPGVGRVLLDRSARREARLATHRAIAQLPRVDQRLLALFAHMAERWGRVAAAGVVIPLQLTHETLGRLIGARRPTVSLALKELAGDGLLERRNDGSWLLRYEAMERLGAEAAVPAGWQAADARNVAAPVAARPGAGNRAVYPTPAELESLRARIQQLRDQHARRIERYTTTLESAREARRGRRREAGGRTAA